MSDLNPKHYEFTVKGHTYQTADLMESMFAEDVHLSQAIKYFLRAGRKPDQSYISDIGKCIWWLVKAIMYRKGTFELPPGAGSFHVPPITTKMKTKKRKS